MDDTSKLIGLIKKIKNDTGKLLEKSTKKFSETYDELQIVEMSLTSAPTDDEIGPLISQLNEMNKEIGSLQTEIEHVHSLVATEKALIKTINVKMREIVADKHKSKRNARGSDIAQKVENVLEEYSQRLRKSKLKLLEDYLLQGIQMLIHKENFIEKVSINKETFEVTLYRKDDDELKKSELSKGEQQMFATAVLWALAKTSGRPLPFIIDTPLARLDKEHRVSLIEQVLSNCFPSSTNLFN